MDAGPVLDAGVIGDGGAASPVPLPLPAEVLTVGPDGGAPVSVDGGGVATTAQFEVRVPLRLPGLRVRLADASTGRAVPSRDRLDVSSTTTYHLHPEAPLDPGTSYLLDIGPNAATQILTDDRGRTYADARVAITTAGEKPKAKAPARRHRRRR